MIRERKLRTFGIAGLLIMLFAFALVGVMSPKALLAALFMVPVIGMSMGATTGLTKAAKCTAAIGTAYTFATPGADDDHFSVANGSNVPLIGVFQGTTINPGDFAEVMVSGITNIVLGNTVTRGQEVTSDANGKGVPVTTYPANTGIWSGGVALKSGVAGDIITMLIEPDHLEPMAAGTIMVSGVSPTGAIVSLADAPATLTAAQLEGSGLFEITPTAARALTTDTAANLVAGMPGVAVGSTFDFTIACLAAFAVTLTSPGAPVTLVGNMVANNSSATFRAIFTDVTPGAEAVTIVRK